MAVPTMQRAGIGIIALLLLSLCALSPASAAVKYSQGSPDFSAAVIGTNEFFPGEEATVQVMVRNNGVNLFKQVNYGTIAQEDLPNAARSVSIRLASTTPLITVKSDPQVVGKIAGNGGSAVVSFNVKIAADATRPSYELPLFIDYQYPVVLAQEAADTFQFRYARANTTIPLAIRVNHGVKAGVDAVTAGDLTVGSEGYITVTIRNTGQEDGTGAVVTLKRNGKSPVVPVDSSVYAGGFAANGTITCRYRVAVSDEAAEQVYPVDLSVTYRNSEGSLVTTPPVTVGIPVRNKPFITAIPAAHEVNAGSSADIAVQYRNDGTVTVYNAQARISAHDPLTFTDNTAFLGDLAPGETKTAAFFMTADSSAEAKEYVFDSRVRYRDQLGTSLESDITGVTIRVLPAKPGLFGTLAGNPVVIALLLIVVIGGLGLLAYRMRKGDR